MIKASIGLQELRRKIYLKAKSEKTWRFWGLYVHVCKMETLRQAYKLVYVPAGKIEEIPQQWQLSRPLEIILPPVHICIYWQLTAASLVMDFSMLPVLILTLNPLKNYSYTKYLSCSLVKALSRKGQ